MEPITLTFLGTGNAVPTERRNHTAILLTYKDENILIDCGEGTQRQFRYAKLSPAKLTRLLITHWHGDHILGLPGILQTLAMTDYQKTLEVHGPKQTKEYFKLLSQLVNIQVSLDIKEHSSGKILETKEFYVEAEQMQHGTPSLAFAFQIKNKLRLDKSKLDKLKLPNSPILGELAKGKDITFEGKKIKAKDVTYMEKGRRVTIILDTKMNERAIKLAKNSDLLICESSFAESESEEAESHKHLTASQAATIAKKAKAEALILTHISQRYEAFPKIIEEEAKKIFKNSKIVKDLDQIIL